MVFRFIIFIYWFEYGFIWIFYSVCYVFLVMIISIILFFDFKVIFLLFVIIIMFKLVIFVFFFFCNLIGIYYFGMEFWMDWCIGYDMVFCKCFINYCFYMCLYLLIFFESSWNMCWCFGNIDDNCLFCCYSLDIVICMWRCFLNEFYICL